MVKLAKVVSRRLGKGASTGGHHLAAPQGTLLQIDNVCSLHPSNWTAAGQWYVVVVGESLLAAVGTSRQLHQACQTVHAISGLGQLNAHHLCPGGRVLGQLWQNGLNGHLLTLHFRSTLADKATFAAEDGHQTVTGVTAPSEGVLKGHKGPPAVGPTVVDAREGDGVMSLAGDDKDDAVHQAAILLLITTQTWSLGHEAEAKCVIDCRQLASLDRYSNAYTGDTVRRLVRGSTARTTATDAASTAASALDIALQVDG